MRGRQWEILGTLVPGKKGYCRRGNNHTKTTVMHSVQLNLYSLSPAPSLFLLARIEPHGEATHLLRIAPLHLCTPSYFELNVEILLWANDLYRIVKGN